MLRSLKTLGLALLAAFGVAMLAALPGSPLVGPALAADDVVLTIDTDGPDGGTDLDFDVGGCTQTSVQLDDSGGSSEMLDCADGTITLELDETAWSLTNNQTTCSFDNGADSNVDSSFAVNEGTQTLTITLTDGETATCQLNAVGTGTGTSTSTPTVTGTPSTATPTATGTVTVSTLTVSIAPSTLSCSGSAFVTVVARDAGGQVVAAGNMTLQTNLGSITPSTAVDQGAGVLAVLTAPANQGGTATVIASAGGKTGQATATINCAQATSTSVPPTAAPQAPAPIVPPSTGDAGLAAGSDWQRVGAFALLGVVLAGAIAIARVRVRA